MVGTCCVKGCKNESYGGCGISFFRFPKNDEIRQKWLEVVPRKSNNLSNTASICDRHFKFEDKVVNIGNSRLKPDAVPCIFPTTQRYQQIYQFKLTQSPFEDEFEDIESSNIASQRIESNMAETLIPQINQIQDVMSIKQEDSQKASNRKYIQVTPIDPSSMKIIENMTVKQTTSDLSTQTYMLLTTPAEKLMRRRVSSLTRCLKKHTTAFNQLRSMLRLIKHKCKNYDDVKEVLALKLKQVPQNLEFQR